MAAYPYYGYPAYNAYGTNYAPVIPQPQTSPQVQPQQQTPNSGVIWVQGEGGAKSYTVAPNTTALLMDSEKPRFYLKSVDASGFPQVLRVFEYTEVTNPAPINSAPSSDEKGKYALKEDLEALRREFAAIKGEEGRKDE